MAELYNIEHRLEEVEQTIQIVSESLTKTDEKLNTLIQGFNTFQEEIAKQHASNLVNISNAMMPHIERLTKDLSETNKSIINHARDISQLHEQNTTIQLMLAEGTAIKKINQIEYLLESIDIHAERLEFLQRRLET